MRRLLLSTSLKLLRTKNAGVILAVASLHWNLGSRKDVTLSKIVRALCAAARGRPEVQDLVYENIISFARRRPHLFQPFLTDFFIKTASDSAGIRTQKLEMLVLLASEGNIAKLLTEFTQYVRHPDKKFVVEVVDAVGRISSAHPKVSKRCLQGLLGLISHPASPDTVVSASVIVMRRILQQRKELDMEIEEMMSKKSAPRRGESADSDKFHLAKTSNCHWLILKNHDF